MWKITTDEYKHDNNIRLLHDDRIILGNFKQNLIWIKTDEIIFSCHFSKYGRPRRYKFHGKKFNRKKLSRNANKHSKHNTISGYEMYLSNHTKEELSTTYPILNIKSNGKEMMQIELCTLEEYNDRILLIEDIIKLPRVICNEIMKYIIAGSKSLYVISNMLNKIVGIIN